MGLIAMMMMMGVVAMLMLILKPLHGRSKTTCATVADPKAVAEHMGQDWAGEDPKKVIHNPRFYTHALACAPDIQTTLIAIPARNLPVQYATDRTWALCGCFLLIEMLFGVFDQCCGMFCCVFLSSACRCCTTHTR